MRGWVTVLGLVLGCTGAIGDADLDDAVGADVRGAPPRDGGPSDARSTTDSKATTDTKPAPDARTLPADATPPPDTAPAADAGPAPDTTPPDTGDPIADARVICVNEINAYRATLKLPPYAGWTSAATCGDGQAKADSATGTAHGAFGKCGENAQNECPGWPGPPDSMIKGCLKSMWAEGPGSFYGGHGHYINMSSKDYTTVACGFYVTSAGAWWSVQDFR